MHKSREFHYGKDGPVLKNLSPVALVRAFIEPKTAIVTVGHGLRRAGRTVRGHVRAEIIRGEQALWAASIRHVVEPSLIPTPAPPSDGSDVEVEL